MSTLPADYTYTRWSDSIERDILKQSLQHSQPVSFTDSHNSIKAFFKKLISGLGKRLMDLSDVLYEARKEEIRLRSNYYR